MYKPREERARRRFNHLMTSFAVILGIVALLYAGVYGMQQSQLATPDDGPVRFYWVTKGTNHGCLVLERGKQNRECDEFTYDELQHYPMHYEDPHKSFPAYFTK